MDWHVPRLAKLRAPWSGFRDRGPHLACPVLKLHSPAFHSRREDRKEWCMYRRGVLLARGVVLLAEEAFQSLRHYRCAVFFVGTGEEGGPRVGSLSEVPWRCATRRTGGPCPNAKSRWKAEPQLVGSPSEAPIPL